MNKMKTEKSPTPTAQRETCQMTLLATPLFVASICLLVLNDFVLKATFHNWLTGKLSDIAGLVAFTLFWCAIWPRGRWVSGFIVSIGFIFWKSPYSQLPIDLANRILPFNVGRVVDYSDLLALPAVWLVCRYSPRLRAWPAQRWLVIIFAGLSLMVFTATSYIPHYNISRSAVIPETYDSETLAVVEGELQRVFDNTAQSYGLQCITCDKLSIGRLYTKNPESPEDFSLAVNFNPQRALVFFDIGTVGPQAPRDKHTVKLLRTEIENKLQARFPDMKITNAEYEIEQLSLLGVWKKKSNTSYRDSENQADYYTTLQIIDHVVLKYGLKRLPSKHPAWIIYYTGRLFGPHPSDHELIVDVDIADSPLVPISVKCYTPEYSELHRKIVDELEKELQAVFGEDRASIR